MIDTQAVRSMLLNKAIHGELSENRSTDADTQDILNSISAERTKLIKLKKTKIGKNVPRLDVELFDLPKGWKWVALGDLCIMLSRGKSPTYSENSIYPVFAQKCNQPTALALEKAKFLDETTVEKWPDYFRLRDHDVVINSTGTGTVGRIGYYTKETLASKYPYMLPDSHVTVARMGTGIISKYIYYVLKSDFLQRIIESQLRGSTNQKEYYIDSVYGTPIPLPSTVEQQKIVQKLDEAYFELTNIDNLQTDYTNNMTSLNKSILDLAVMGKLVPQDPNDEPASVLLKKIAEEHNKVIVPIVEDIIPFEIPESWEWVRFDVISNILGTGLIRPKTAQSSNRKYAYFKMNNIGNFTGECNFKEMEHVDASDEEVSKYRIKENDFLFNTRNSRELVGKTAVVPSITEDIILNNNILKIRFWGGINPYYINYFFISEHGRRQLNQFVSSTTNVAAIYQKQLVTLMVPIPPIEEQSRIVKEINKFIPFLKSK